MTPQALPDQPLAARPQARSIESVLENRWARLLIPSLSDLFLLAILVWLFMSSGASGWQGLLADADVGWHIRTGEYILDHHAVPQADIYSFSKPNAPWYAWEWLTDVMDGALHRWAGLKGIVLAAAILISVFSTTLIQRMVWRGTNLLIALAIALLGVGSSSIHFLARPHIFTLLLLSVSVWMIEADRRKASVRIWWLLPITIVWTNLHGGFLALIAVLGLTAVGSVVEMILDAPAELRFKPEGLVTSLRAGGRYAALAAACAAASLVNPYGWNLHKHVLEYLRSDWIKTVIQEFQSPSFRTENMMQFEALLIAGLIVAGAQFRSKRIVEGLWIVFWAHMALASVRHVPVFVAVVAPILATQISEWWNTATATAKKSSLMGILNQMSADSLAGFRRTSAIPLVVFAALAIIDQPVRWPTDFPDVLFPTAIVHKHADKIFGQRVLTTDQWGDYLIYLDPKQKVYVDGRSDFYGPETGNEYIRLLNGGWDWDRTVDKYGFTTALFPVENAAAQLLKQRKDWRTVEDNGKQILFVRTSPAFPSIANSNSSDGK
jgi:hypothetical protein